jgi:hypothetical protein
VLNIRENSELLKELFREYITESFVTQVKDIMYAVINKFNINFDIQHLSSLNIELLKTSIFIINKILLDNIFRYIVIKNINRFVHLINNNTFYMDIYINPFYTKQLIDVILKYINLDENEIVSITHILNNKLLNIINQIYIDNSRFLNPVLLNLFNSLYDSLGFINVNYYKFELDQFNRPILIYSEK